MASGRKFESLNTLPRGEVNLLLSLEGSAPVRGSLSLRLTLRGPSHGGLGFNGGECNRVDNTHPDTLARPFHLRPVTVAC